MAVKGFFKALNSTQKAQRKRYASNAKTAQQVTETETQECTELVVQDDLLPQKVEKPMPESITATTEFVGKMDDYDRAVEIDTLSCVHSNLALNKTARIITDGKGRQLEAWINEDETGARIISVVQRYWNGNSSPELKMSQGDVVISSIAASTMDVSMQRRVKHFLMKTGEQYWSTFRGQDGELMNMQELITVLFSELSHIPVYLDDITEVERIELYQKIVDFVQRIPSMIMNTHKAYFPLTEEEIQDVARNMGLTKLNLLKKLKKFNFLYLTPSSRGYQTSIRINGIGLDSYTAWRYCIIRIEDLEKSDEEVCDYNF